MRDFWCSPALLFCAMVCIHHECLCTCVQGRIRDADHCLARAARVRPTYIPAML